LRNVRKVGFAVTVFNKEGLVEGIVQIRFTTKFASKKA
jgi:hypothetical protein